MEDSSKALYDVWPKDKKAEFFPGYLYLKYTIYFVSIFQKILGMPHIEPDKNAIPKEIYEMIEFFCQIILLNFFFFL